MRAREHRSLAITMIAIATVSIPFVDTPLAHAIRGSALENNPILQGGTLLLDWITGKEIWRYLLATLLLAPGLVLMTMPRARQLGACLVFVGAVHGLASVIVANAKPLVGRMRPHEFFTTSTDAWFAGGSSFPSGHTAFYFGLCLPLAWLFPRRRTALLVVPVFIAVARLNANDHFLADVSTSIALCCILTLLFARVLGRWLPAHAADSLSTRP